MESVNDILRNTASMGQGDPLCPEVAGNPIRSYGYFREDTLKELARAMTPPPLRL
jgi:hypothetical protein